MSDGAALVADVCEQLEARAEEYADIADRVTADGRANLEDLADLHRDAVALLNQYEDTATETGAKGFADFAQFKMQFTRLADAAADLPDDGAIEAARDAIDKRRLSGSDFDRARAELDPITDRVSRLDDMEAARQDLIDARDAAASRREQLQAELEEREQVLALADVDLEAPVDDLRDPIERWNEGVAAAVTTLRQDRPARKAMNRFERIASYPLIDMESPPEELKTYLNDSEAGTHTIAELLEYADHSPSKLRHYVDDPDTFRRIIRTRRSSLEALEADPLQIDWPPPPAESIPWLARELRGAIGSLVDDAAIGALREVVALARDESDYEHVREAAMAHEQLDADDRQRLESGAIEAEIEIREEAIAAIDEALQSAPDP